MFSIFAPNASGMLQNPHSFKPEFQHHKLSNVEASIVGCYLVLTGAFSYFCLSDVCSGILSFFLNSTAIFVYIKQRKSLICSSLPGGVFEVALFSADLSMSLIHLCCSTSAFHNGFVFSIFQNNVFQMDF